MSHMQIDRKSSEIMAALATAPVFKKQGWVRARQAEVGEVVTTTLANGATETTNTAKDGDWVMTNPDGEQYIISKDKFFARYENTYDVGLYVAKGHCRAMTNPYGEPIEIMASWGSPQTGDAHCLIADTCDADGDNMGGEPYLIDADAFEKTYSQV